MQALAALQPSVAGFSPWQIAGRKALLCPVWWPLASWASWYWRNISLPPICCQKILAQGGEGALQPDWVLTWRWVHELVWVVAEQSILDVAPAHAAGPCREGGMDTGAWQEVLKLLCSSEERCSLSSQHSQSSAPVVWGSLLWCSCVKQELLFTENIL